MATATKMQRWVSKSYQCSSSSLWSHLTSQAATSPSYESSEWAKATAYWEKTTAHSQELSSSLLKLTHKLQVHTRNLKITLLLEFKGSNWKFPRLHSSNIENADFFSYTNRSLGTWDWRQWSPGIHLLRDILGRSSHCYFRSLKMLSKSRTTRT